QDAPGAAGERPGDLHDLQLLDRPFTARGLSRDVEPPLAPDGAGPAPPPPRVGRGARPPRSRQLTSCGTLPRKTFSATDRSGTIIECWNTVAIHSRQRPMSPTRGAGSPPNRTVPASGSDRPDRMETRVDLPAPFLPTRPRHWPAAMERSTPRRARVV